MKIKILCDKDNYNKYIEEINEGQIEITESEADLLLIEKDYKDKNIIGKKDGEYKIISPLDILYIESYGNVVLCKTITDEYEIREKLYEVENKFYLDGYVRVNKSYVVNKNYIESIKPTINLKLILTMKDKSKIDVTRSYYYKFKEYIGF